MKKVALTGNIGSGKSWVSQLFQRIGIPVFNSDEEAKRLYDRNDIREAMKARFGEDVYFDDNVFCDNRALTRNGLRDMAVRFQCGTSCRGMYCYMCCL